MEQISPILLDQALPLPLQIIGADGDVLSENAAYLSRFRRDDETEKLLAAALRGGHASAIRAAMAGSSRVVPLGPVGATAFDARYFPIRDAAGTVVRVGIVFVEVRDRTIAAPPPSGSIRPADVDQSLLYILDRMPQLLWTTTPDGLLDFCNRRWCEYTGARVEDIRGSGWIETLHPDDQERTWRRWAHSVETGEGYEIEYRFRGADGEYRWFLGRGVPLHDESGHIFRWVGTCTDVDDQKRIAQERAEVLAQSEANSRMKDEFLAAVSHELRTPLTAILGWARMLRLRPELASKAIEVIERNSQAQAKLIEDVLDTSRIVTGKVQLRTQKTDLNVLAQSAVDTIRPTADAKRVNLEVRLEDGLAQVFCDPDRMQQVILNVLVNAVKFTEKHGRVSVRTFAGSGEVALSVSDTGKGIPPSFLPFVFDSFRQADATITRRQGGLGLGLAIVKHLVELHSGTIRASSEGEGKGATFEIRLPVKAVSESSSHDQVQRGFQLRPGEATRLDDLHVLVVDDEHDARELVAMVLQDAGAVTTEAASAAAALEAIDRLHVDVLVSDIGMPVQDGYSLVRELRTRALDRGGGLPALALSAFTRTEDIERAREAGFQLHLAKPVEPIDLVVAVRELSMATSQIRPALT